MVMQYNNTPKARANDPYRDLWRTSILPDPLPAYKFIVREQLNVHEAPAEAPLPKVIEAPKGTTVTPLPSPAPKI